jgi:hypothetical protein
MTAVKIASGSCRRGVVLSSERALHIIKPDNV